MGYPYLSPLYFFCYNSLIFNNRSQAYSYSLRFQLHRIRNSNTASATPQNQLPLAECTCRKIAWCVAMCYAGYSTPTIPPPQHRKISCTLQNAVVEKFAWWAARWHAGYSTPPTPHCIRSTAKSIAVRKLHL